ncbi:PREDICTED: swi5-dependent recombination DNA repair protein 1 homolog, partial [Ficedula albicollis]|uniref:swi5-dependent recombination DNA repair protein 1 homolog n=1 Tax=Ficedula albicollis TaxID=59894 RepID=UPI0007AD86FF
MCARESPEDPQNPVRIPISPPHPPGNPKNPPKTPKIPSPPSWDTQNPLGTPRILSPPTLGPPELPEDPENPLPTLRSPPPLPSRPPGHPQHPPSDPYQGRGITPNTRGETLRSQIPQTQTLSPTSPQADKLELQRQLHEATSSKKTLEGNNQQSRAELAKATQERDRCQQDLKSASTEGDLSRVELEVQKHKCSSLQSDLSEKLPRISELVRQFQCKEAENELGQIRGRVENLFRQQQGRDSQFIWRGSCELSVRQCRLNCSREMQEMERRVQGMEKREKEAAEERRRAEAERDKAGKELEEKRKAAVAQAEALREQLVACMAKVPHLALPASRVPLGAGRSGSFPVPGPYMELLGNPATLGTLGESCRDGDT